MGSHANDPASPATHNHLCCAASVATYDAAICTDTCVCAPHGRHSSCSLPLSDWPTHRHGTWRSNLIGLLIIPTACGAFTSPRSGGCLLVVAETLSAQP